jgi:O-antigen ligase
LLAFALVGLLVFAAWQNLSSSTIYKERLGVTETVRTRDAIRHESLELFREKPLFGWGYNTFNQVKLTLPSRDPGLERETSHDTFLTVLVELGMVGLALFVLPWAVITYRVVTAAWRGLGDRWVIAGGVGATVSFAIGALTYDARFFSFISALPWIALGLARSTLTKSA